MNETHLAEKGKQKRKKGRRWGEKETRASLVVNLGWLKKKEGKMKERKEAVRGPDLTWTKRADHWSITLF